MPAFKTIVYFLVFFLALKVAFLAVILVAFLVTLVLVCLLVLVFVLPEFVEVPFVEEFVSGVGVVCVKLYGKSGALDGL